jgi:hypothetical protein
MRQGLLKFFQIIARILFAFTAEGKPLFLCTGLHFADMTVGTPFIGMASVAPQYLCRLSESVGYILKPLGIFLGGNVKGACRAKQTAYRRKLFDILFGKLI